MIYLKKLFLLAILHMSAATNAFAENKISTFVSILPQQYFVQRVGGELVDVHVMVGPGQNPATYEPTPQQMVALANADIYFSIGVPFEKVWIDKIKKSNNQLIVIECCESLSNLDAHSHHDDHTDPHIWTSPKKVIQLVKLIKESLVNIRNVNSIAFEKSANNFIDELHELDVTIKTRLSLLKQRSLIVSHPSWSYFAHDYDLTQISIEQDGKEIQVRSMVNLIKLAKENNIKAVYVQRQFNDKAAHIIAKEINATVYELDPLAFNYIENINDVVNKIMKGLYYE